MDQSINQKISQAIEILKEEVREGKALGKPSGKLLDKNTNKCYVFSVLRDAGVVDFDSEVHMNQIVNYITEKVAVEVVRIDPHNPNTHNHC